MTEVRFGYTYAARSMNDSGVSGAWLAGFLSRSVSKGLVFAFMVAKVYPRPASTLSKRYTSVELIVAQSAWTPRSRKPRSTRFPDDMVHVRIGYGENDLRAKLKALGALWRPQCKLCELPWGVVRGMRLESRGVEP